ncbi:MAG: hypothetical protein J6U84_05530 [Bacteroidales bacterium]|nr:hypothetical protein [Bacteroidales bacterium]
MKLRCKSKSLLYFVCFIVVSMTTFSAYAQCPFGEKVNCLGECGRFFDDNGDSYCDNGLVQVETAVAPTETPTETVKEVEAVKAKEVTAEKTIQTPVKNVTEETFATEKIEEEQTVVTQTTTTEEAKPVVNRNKKPYRVVLISIIVLIAYLVTFILVKTNKMKKLTHRKIWNAILLITFLVSCLLGFILALQINYGFCMEWYRDFLKLHVEFGIAMTIVAFIHAIWHYRYYITMFSKKK